MDITAGAGKRQREDVDRSGMSGGSWGGDLGGVTTSGGGSTSGKDR